MPPPLHSTPPLVWFPSEYWNKLPFGTQKLVWIPDGEKVWDVFRRFGRIPACDRRTDEQTDILRQTSMHMQHRAVIMHWNKSVVWLHSNTCRCCETGDWTRSSYVSRHGVPENQLCLCSIEASKALRPKRSLKWHLRHFEHIFLQLVQLPQVGDTKS